ncbi:recombinase family protein, partial [Candidatus Binatia bacterium]|nr:recombinase family protein [Candidatus Binatia bacterium]
RHALSPSSNRSETDPQDAKERERLHIGSAPFGMAWTATGELVPVDDEIETVELVRQLRDEGLSLREIADRLTADGRRTKRGGRWYPSTIRNVLGRAA